MRIRVLMAYGKVNRLVLLFGVDLFLLVLVIYEYKGVLVNFIDSWYLLNEESSQFGSYIEI